MTGNIELQWSLQDVSLSDDTTGETWREPQRSRKHHSTFGTALESSTHVPTVLSQGGRSREEMWGVGIDGEYLIVYVFISLILL